jgi:hypothetical protein
MEVHTLISEMEVTNIFLLEMGDRKVTIEQSGFFSSH